MSSDMKILLAFLGGAALGAGAILLMNREKPDLGKLGKLASELLNKGAELKDMAEEKLAEMSQSAPENGETRVDQS